MHEHNGKTYLTCAETAKLVRAALKAEFPGVKFSVRSHTYAGGASIDITWTDGPIAEAVDRVAKVFSGADFDGMIDLKTYSDHWLEPDGSVTIAHAQGTEASRGYLPEVINDPPSPSARLVSFGADFIFSNRNRSEAFKADIEAWIERHTGRPFDSNERYECVPLPAPIRGREYATPEYGSTVAHQVAAAWDRR
jgi:hypothetical protein